MSQFQFILRMYTIKRKFLLQMLWFFDFRLVSTQQNMFYRFQFDFFFNFWIVTHQLWCIQCSLFLWPFLVCYVMSALSSHCSKIRNHHHWEHFYPFSFKMCICIWHYVFWWIFRLYFSFKSIFHVNHDNANKIIRLIFFSSIN